MTQDREELIACLRKVESSGNPLNIGSTTNWHRNPEGPQAADLILSLLSDLEAMQEAYRKKFCTRCGMVAIVAVAQTCGEMDCPLVSRLPIKQKQWRLDHPCRLDPQGSHARQAIPKEPEA